MENEDTSNDSPKKSKRKLNETETKQDTKKQRLFNAAEFKKQLQTDDALNALNTFRQLANENEEDVIYEYLRNGGDCLELLRILETNSNIPPTLILDIVNQILLLISTKYPQFRSSTYEACRYFLNTCITLINKMLNLSSSSNERKVILKLLTAIIMFSPTYAKDILVNVNFNPTNLELLTKHVGGDKDSVRNAYIHFLVAFLIDGHYPSLAVLLDKRNLLTSIVGGLKYDTADTACIVLAAFKNHILENIFVQKTVKMKIFSTPVVKDIVKLYNWKGPQGCPGNKKKQKVVNVNESDKSKVSESVHDFLLVLCTSHKHGVIFKDKLIGLGKKVKNPLIYTVLESLENPWDHSYGSELVIKICGACPDLVRSVWLNLKLSLEPRPTKKWLNAVNFAKQLLDELKPENLEFAAKELSSYQLLQLLQTLLIPLPILKTLIPENTTYEKQTVKQAVLELLINMLKATNNYLKAAKNWLNTEKWRSLKDTVSSYIFRNFPHMQNIFDNWDKQDDDSYNFSNYLIVIFDLLELYKTLSPQLLDDLMLHIDLQQFLQEINNLSNNDALMVKAVHLFLNLEPSVFLPQTQLFTSTFLLLLKLYYNTNSVSSRDTLIGILQNTSLFDGSENETPIWIDGILNLKSWDEEVGNFLVQAINLAYSKLPEYLDELSQLKDGVSHHSSGIENFEEILESLNGDVCSISAKAFVKHTILSPLLKGVLNYASIQFNTSVKIYLNFVVLNLLHLQTDPTLLVNLLTDTHAINSNISVYVQNWGLKFNCTVLEKCKGRLDAIPKFSKALLSGCVDSFLNSTCDAYPDQKLNFLQMCLFYLVNNKNLNEEQSMSCLEYCTYLFNNNFNFDYAKIIFSHPVLLQQFSPLHLNRTEPKAFVTHFVLKLVKQLQSFDVNQELEKYLANYRKVVATAVKKILKKSKSIKTVENLMETIEVFQLEYAQCIEILDYISKMDEINCVTSIIIKVLKVFVKLCQNNDALAPLEQKIVNAVAALLTNLNNQIEQLDTSALAEIITEYFKIFPHQVDELETKLFESVLNKPEYCKNNASLAIVLFNCQTSLLLPTFQERIEQICNKKGLLLPFLDVLVKHGASDEILKSVYSHFEPSLIKALQKPHKAGQHFAKHYKAVTKLLQKFMLEESCRKYVEKVQKYETSEIFHSHLLAVVFTKIANNTKFGNNAILTFIHLGLNIFKKTVTTEEDWSKLDAICGKCEEFASNINFEITIAQNENFKLYSKFCLKFGLSGRSTLLKTLATLCRIININSDDISLLVEMIVSHSEFLDVALSDGRDCKTQLFRLLSLLCNKCPEVLERNHIPIFLAAYRASLTEADRYIFILLKLCEKHSAQTCFYDFKPFLWDRAAAGHYSVRSDVQKALWRQPRTGDVLDILQEHWVFNTIERYPLSFGLEHSQEQLDDEIYKNVYDLAFMLPLFSQLLASESVIQTHKFSRSGGLSLTIVALSSYNKDVRSAACHVLARYHHHLEAKQTSKGNLLWLSFIEALCRGTAVVDYLMLNNFAAIFLARMAWILTEPTHVMYLPLTQYLSAKATLDLGGIPELYTLLHSSEVDYKEHRAFILKILCDGLRSERDFDIALRSMAFKFIMELFSSCISDTDCQLLVLDVIKNACRIPRGAQLLCSSYGLLSWLNDIICNFSSEVVNVLLPSSIAILKNIVSVAEDYKTIDLNVVMLTLTFIIDKYLTVIVKDYDLIALLEITVKIFEQDSSILNKNRLRNIILVAGDKKCEYFLNYGRKWYEDFNENFVVNKSYYVRKLTMLWNRKFSL